ncbi:RNA chaperone Hfq [Bartonella sp. DGB1]|uniref:RNA chaperone Hfq n=1 Tax=Bartonella sp. DGB1 TaxID=3239807 RepID=UPI0035264CCA
MIVRSNVLQEEFLTSLQQNKISLTIFLVNGVKLTGLISAFDTHCVMLTRDKHKQLVYKHAISTIMPDSNFNLDLEAKVT